MWTLEQNSKKQGKEVQSVNKRHETGAAQRNMEEINQNPNNSPLMHVSIRSPSQLWC